MAQSHQGAGKAVDKGGGRTQCDEHVHIGHAVQQAFDGAAAKEQHPRDINGQAYDQLNPWVHQPFDAHHVQDEGQRKGKTKKKTFQVLIHRPAHGGLLIVADDGIAQVVDALLQGLSVQPFRGPETDVPAGQTHLYVLQPFFRDIY
ncbi:hypothetical protein ACQ86N_40930 [Puia sp. P3]|uniref:hypothetical protein n=1 Tax=Puia sp. P3 TaxID=3423952 RepID=UPI003D67B5D6